VTLAQIKQLVLDDVPFVIQDSKTAVDITSSVLLQILTELEEQESVLSPQMLQDLIRCHGAGMEGLLGQYLEQSMAAFIAQQQSVQEQLQRVLEQNLPDSASKSDKEPLK